MEFKWGQKRLLDLMYEVAAAAADDDDNCGDVSTKKSGEKAESLF
jgi:hypothetical protein